MYFGRTVGGGATRDNFGHPMGLAVVRAIAEHANFTAPSAIIDSAGDGRVINYTTFILPSFRVG